MICRLDGIWRGHTSCVLLATAIETILTLKSMIPGSQTVVIWYCPDLLSNVALGLQRLWHQRIPTNRTYRVFIFGRRICLILHGVMCTLDCHLLDLSEGRSIDRVHWFLHITVLILEWEGWIDCEASFLKIAACPCVLNASTLDAMRKKTKTCFIVLCI